MLVLSSGSFGVCGNRGAAFVHSLRFYRDCIGSVRISPLQGTSLSSLISSPSLLLLLLPLPLLDLLLCPDLTVVLCFRLSLDLCSFVSLRHYQLSHDQQRNTKTPSFLTPGKRSPLFLHLGLPGGRSLWRAAETQDRNSLLFCKIE